MSDAVRYYLLPRGLGADGLREILAGRWEVRVGPSVREELTCHDTFDWRLWRRGMLLAGTADFCRWEVTATGRCLGRAAHPLPAFARDLPEGSLRTRLAPVTEPRLLAPLVRLRRNVTPVEARNREGKVVFRLHLERGRALAAGGGVGGPGRPLPPLLRLETVRGYGEEAREAVSLLGGTVPLRPWERTPLDFALEAVGRVPGDYSPSFRLRLSGEETIGEALRQVLLKLHGALAANVPGAAAGVDTEFLHDLRVAVRRTNSALSQMRRHLAGARICRFRRELRGLGRMTGELRNMDVHLLTWPRLAALVPAKRAAYLEPLRRRLEDLRAREQATLAAHLTSPRFGRFLEEWRSFLDHPPPDAFTGRARRPVRQESSRLIRKARRRVMALGTAIGDATPAEDLHRLRILCKRLRYLLEFFQSLHPPEGIRGLVGGLRELQDNLGEFQDLAVQRQVLGDLAARGKLPRGSAKAVRDLLAALARRQDEVREDFTRRFRGFAARRVQDGFRRLFGRTGRGEGA
jgi:CHAD domain-containing protein